MKLKFLGTTLAFLVSGTSTFIYANCNIISSQDTSRLNYIVNKYSNRNPFPLMQIQTEGKLPNQPEYINSKKAITDLTAMHDLAFAWKNGINSNQALTLSQNYLKAWVATYKPTYNPIDEGWFIPMIDTYGIIRETFSSSDRARIDSYFKQWASTYISKMNGAFYSGAFHSNGTWTSNWQSYRVNLVTMMAFVVKDKKLIESAKELYQRQIQQNIDSKGQTLDFKQRDAIHYVVFDLEPLVNTALVAKNNGQDWYNYVSPTGSSLPNAIKWLNQYVVGGVKHDEFVNTTIKFDTIRGQHGLRGFSGFFNPKDASNLYWKVTELDPSYINIAEKLNDRKPADVTVCW